MNEVVREIADEASLRELVRSLLEKVRELETRLAALEARPLIFGPPYPSPSLGPPWEITCRHVDLIPGRLPDGHSSMFGTSTLKVWS